MPPPNPNIDAISPDPSRLLKCGLKLKMKPTQPTVPPPHVLFLQKSNEKLTKKVAVLQKYNCQQTIAEDNLRKRLSTVEAELTETKKMIKLMADRQRSRSCDLCEKRNGVVCVECFEKERLKVKKTFENTLDKSLLAKTMRALMSDLEPDDSN